MQYICKCCLHVPLHLHVPSTLPYLLIQLHIIELICTYAWTYVTLGYRYLITAHRDDRNGRRNESDDYRWWQTVERRGCTGMTSNIDELSEPSVTMETRLRTDVWAAEPRPLIVHQWYALITPAVLCSWPAAPSVVESNGRAVESRKRVGKIHSVHVAYPLLKFVHPVNNNK